HAKKRRPLWVLVLVTPEPPLAHAILDGAPTDAQDRGRLRGRAVDRFQCLHDGVTLELGERNTGDHESYRLLVAPLGVERKIAHIDELTLAQHHRLLDDVLQL